MLHKTMTFLRNIGLNVEFKQGAKGFIPGVQICHGGLLVDPACKTSNLLHEAAHIAIVPSMYRHLMNNDVDKSVKSIFHLLNKSSVQIDHPLHRAMLQAGECEATAWSWAAGIHLGIPGEMIIEDEQYQNGGADIRLALQYSSYFGINGLRHAGMCEFGYWVPEERRYPVMKKWLQDIAL